MRRSLPCLVFVALGSLVGVQASERFGIELKAGTLGLGVDLTGKINNYVSLRGTYSKYDYDRTFDNSGITYDGTLELGATGLFADVYPMGGNFRVSGGYLQNRNAIRMVSTPTAPIEIGGTTYEPADIGTLSGDVTFQSSVPYLGIGWGNAARGPGRVKFMFDAGVVKQGSGDAALRTTGTGVSDADLRTEEAQIESDIKDYQYWPLISVGIGIRF